MQGVELQVHNGEKDVPRSYLLHLGTVSSQREAGVGAVGDRQYQAPAGGNTRNAVGEDKTVVETGKGWAGRGAVSEVVRRGGGEQRAGQRLGGHPSETIPRSGAPQLGGGRRHQVRRSTEFRSLRLGGGSETSTYGHPES